MSLPSPSDAVEIRARHFAGLFLLSLATLLLELALTRIMSVSLWYHFGFLVISTALLGFGVSGVTLALWADLRERKDLDLALGICGLAFAVCVVFSFWCMQRIPFHRWSKADAHRIRSENQLLSRLLAERSDHPERAVPRYDQQPTHP